MVRQDGGPRLTGGHWVEIGEERDGVLTEEEKHGAEADPRMQSVQVAEIVSGDKEVRMEVPNRHRGHNVLQVKCPKLDS